MTILYFFFFAVCCNYISHNITHYQEKKKHSLNKVKFTTCTKNLNVQPHPITYMVHIYKGYKQCIHTAHIHINRVATYQHKIARTGIAQNIAV
jgi:hypothetical protein